MRRPIPFLLLALAACGGGTTPFGGRAEGDVLVRSGTSFGMCMGYCVTEVAVLPTEIVLTRASHNQPGRYPTLTLRRAIDSTEWRAVVALADARAFADLDEVYGCPDCADGGAEWVEVERDGEVRRVTFEHGSAVEGIQPLIESMRRIRASFPER